MESNEAIILDAKTGNHKHYKNSLKKNWFKLTRHGHQFENLAPSHAKSGKSGKANTKVTKRPIDKMANTLPTTSYDFLPVREWGQSEMNVKVP